MLRNSLIAMLCLIAFFAGAAAQEPSGSDSNVFWIGLANGTEAEARMASELRALLRNYDLDPWILTRSVLIDARQIPHSHPILTIHTRDIGKELELLATFVHEELHWLEEGPWLREFRATMAELEEVFPEVPSSSEGGAIDAESTYRHLLVCDLEYQAMTALVGAAAAKRTLAATDHYQWIYDKVLNDARVRDVVLRHGFDLSKGAPAH